MRFTVSPRLSVPFLASVLALGCNDTLGVEVLEFSTRTPVDTLTALGESVQLAVFEGGSDGHLLSNPGLEWKSSNTDVALVTGTGLVTAVGPGTADISATMSGSVAARVPVIVHQVVDSVEVVFDNPAVIEADSVRARARVFDRNRFLIAGRTVAWSVDDPLLGRVDEAGTVTALRKGSLTVTATVDGRTASASLEIADGFLVSAIDGGPYHVCGVDLEGGGWCWPGNGRAVRVPGTRRFTEVSPGDFHFCGVTVDSTAYCWGSNNDGELGGGFVSRFVDTLVLVGNGLKFSTISAGSHSSVCGIGTDNTPYCWGHNDRGQLGRGFSSHYEVSIVPPLGGFLVKSIQLAALHACALGMDGNTYCWGEAPGTGVTRSDSPVIVSTGSRFVQISVGTVVSCGLQADGAAYCWGYNLRGSLGTGETANSLTPAPVAGGLRFRTLDVDVSHVCGITTDGALYCWGDGETFGLSPGNRFGPVPVPVDIPFTELAVSDDFTCGRTALGSVLCWGLNYPEPSRVAGFENGGHFTAPPPVPDAGNRDRLARVHTGPR